MKNQKKKQFIVRSQNAGVFAGEIVSRKGSEVVMKNARRIWYWSGASSLSELAIKGTANPASCKFPIAVPSVIILGVIEIIEMSEVAINSINSVPEWKQHN